MQTKNGKPSPKPDTLPGTVQPEYVRCGNAGCRCARGALHGPYWRRNYWQDGQRRRQYIRLAAVPEARTATAAWRDERGRLREQRRESRALLRLLRQFSRLSDELLGWLEEE